MSLRLRMTWLVIALIVVVPLLGGCTGDPVPDVRGQRFEAARFALQRAGFRIGKIEYDEDAEGPAGFIVGQYPRAESLATPGDDIDLVISGALLVRVPMLMGKDAQDARSEVRDAGLRGGRVLEEHHEYIPAGTVISQEIRPGSYAPKDTKLDYVVSLGPKDAPVPPVVGRWEEDAEVFLGKIGFDSRVSREHDRQPEGVVIDQFPDARTDLELTRDVRLTVSRGPLLTAVPDVRGHGADSATRMLESRHLKVTYRAGNGVTLETWEDGVVDAQEPVGGSRVFEGADVVIWLRASDR